eukprot:TRINITY_DN20246_c0_g1_i1.p2 TRINITY_DN20246_c0_g1~~TRINITY_DN20246_c0_g1_i1.p2  ORF type:complete len:114 (+),score=32.43 TRINITY_DN20246_c0_g1_i1:58-399(+)
MNGHGEEDHDAASIQKLNQNDRIGHQIAQHEEDKILDHMEHRQKALAGTAAATREKRFRAMRARQDAFERQLERQDPFGNSDSFLESLAGWFAVLLPLALIARFAFVYYSRKR